MADRQKDKKMSSQRGFLSRWSDRKTLAAQGEVLPEEAELLDQNVEAENRSDSNEDAALSDEELLKKYDLPDPETVEDEIELDRFMSGKVPERLRQMALRRLWRVNPLFGVIDDMVEYGEDFTDAATVIEGMQTAYTVGKGYLNETLQAEENSAKLDRIADDKPVAEELQNNDNDVETGGDDNSAPESQKVPLEGEKFNADNSTSENSLGEGGSVSDNLNVNKELPIEMTGSNNKNLIDADRRQSVNKDALSKRRPMDVEKKHNENSDLDKPIQVRPQRMVFQKNK